MKIEDLTGDRRWLAHVDDAFALLEAMPDSSVDHVITDPPYSERTHAGARKNTARGSHRAINAQPLIDFESLSDFQFLQLSRHLVRVARRWVVMTCDNHHVARLLCSDLPIVRMGIWIKPNGAPQFTGDRPGMGYETIAILHGPEKMRWNGGGKHAVWNFPTQTKDTLQPTQKPLSLIRQLVADFTDPDDVILDPFMGSGTTAIAALSLDRRFLGCERDKARYAAAMNRIEAWATQLRLPMEIAG